MSEIASRLLNDVPVVVGMYLILRILGKAGFRGAELIPWIVGAAIVLAFVITTPDPILDWIDASTPLLATFLLWLLEHIPTIALFGFVAWLAFTKWPVSETGSQIERRTATPAP